jgi:hypothetical protein
VDGVRVRGSAGALICLARKDVARLSSVDFSLKKGAGGFCNTLGIKRTLTLQIIRTNIILHSLLHVLKV